MENRIHLELSETELTTTEEATATLQNTLGPKLKTLTPDDRRKLPKMGDGTEPFVVKSAEYAKSNPEFLPPYVSADALAVDLKAIETLNTQVRPLRQLVNALDDSIMLAGSEAYTAALSYYNNVKQALKMGVPGAEAIYKDLKQRFENQGPKTTPDPSTPE